MADYCTLVDLKLRLDIVGAQSDAQLAALITAASRWIDRHCRAPMDAFAASASTQRQYGVEAVAGQTLYLDAPVLSIVSIVNGDGSTLPSSAWWLRPRHSVGWYVELKPAYAWAFADDNLIVVDGVWGLFSTPPAPVREAALVLAGWMFKRWQSALADASVNVDLGELTYSEATPRQVQALLAPYCLTIGAVE